MKPPLYHMIAVVAAYFSTPWAVFHQWKIQRLGRGLTVAEWEIEARAESLEVLF